ncbi:MAG: hypothetical protein ABJA10_02655 [Aestuariivirga sp.]
MRDYIQFQALSRAPRGLLGALRQFIANWRLRKDLRLLMTFNDYELRDIGLTGHDLLRLIKRPSDCDLRWEMEQMSVEITAAEDKAREAHEEPSTETYQANPAELGR